MPLVKSVFRRLLSCGDRRSIADSERVRALVDQRPSRVKALATLTADEDWLVSQRALDLLEKFAHEHPAWIEPYKKVFIGPLADSDKWEIRLQIVRALPLSRWTAAQAKRVEQILRDNVAFPQTFVRAWALGQPGNLRGTKGKTAAGGVATHLEEFAHSLSKALQAWARAIRERLAAG